jgi:hypothetical protein
MSFGPFGSAPEETMGLSHARGLEAEQAARQHRGHQLNPYRSGRSIKRVILIGLGLFVLFGWTMTILTTLRTG